MMQPDEAAASIDEALGNVMDTLDRLAAAGELNADREQVRDALEAVVTRVGEVFQRVEDVAKVAEVPVIRPGEPSDVRAGMTPLEVPVIRPGGTSQG